MIKHSRLEKEEELLGMDFKGRIREILVFFFLLIPLVYFIVVKNFTSRNHRHSFSKMDVMEDHRYRQVIGAPHMITLDWAKMRPNQLLDIFIFISAYHDNRIIGVGSKFKVGGLDFKTWILTIVCVKIYVKCMHPLLKSGGAEAPLPPLVLRP